MGSVYNRGSPERPNIWIKYTDADGAPHRRGVGHVNPKGKTQAEVRREEKELRKVARLALAKIELDVAAGRLGLPDPSAPRAGDWLYEPTARPWAEGRNETHRNARTDLGRVNNHLIPFFGKMRLRDIGAKQLKRFIAAKRGQLSRGTIIHCLNLVSRMYNDLIEDGHADLVNPVTLLDRATRRSIGPKHDAKRTPFLRRKMDIRAVYLALPPPPSPLRPMFATGVFAGPRTGELRGLERDDVDLRARRIHLVRSVDGPLKDDESRVVPINDTLLPILREWMLRQGGAKVLFPPRYPRRGGRRGSPATHIRQQTMAKHLRAALRSAELDEALTWYQCTRHTFASHWVMDGRPMKKLAEILGHASVNTTERYAHLTPESFGRADYEAVTVDLREGAVVEELGTDQDTPSEEGFTAIGK